MIPIKRALLSVSDKSGLVEFAAFLQKKGVELLSTGGTFKILQEENIPVLSVAEYTGFPEILGGRVKTLHPKIHGGLLARRDVEEDQVALKAKGIASIDLLIVNLYPFAETIVKSGDSFTKASFAEAIENIDIGGPAMLRAAAKNFENRIVVCDVGDYKKVMQALREEGGIAPELSLDLASKVFAHTASYDSLIANYLNSFRKEKLPEKLTLSYQKIQSLRYGENPHQEAAFYQPVIEVFREKQRGQKNWQKLQGKELSFNNILDADAALQTALALPRPGVVIVKHLNPCGAALISKRHELELLNLEKNFRTKNGGELIGEGSSLNSPANKKGSELCDSALCDAFLRARACDPISAFGAIIAVRGEVAEALAQAISQNFVEVIIAQSYSPQALEIFAKKKNVRLLLCENGSLSSKTNTMTLRNAMGGLLYQEQDAFRKEDEGGILQQEWQIVSQKKADASLLEGMEFAWSMAKHIKSNAIVFCSIEETLGLGAGQMSRLDSVEIAVSKAKKAGLDLKGSIVASDAFFPFRDGIDALAQAGAGIVVQPGGSVRDEEVIAAANEHALVMAFTGIRHFRH